MEHNKDCKEKLKNRNFKKRTKNVNQNYRRKVEKEAVGKFEKVIDGLTLSFLPSISLFILFYSSFHEPNTFDQPKPQAEVKKLKEKEDKMKYST